jgi:hypothetical protein
MNKYLRMFKSANREMIESMKDSGKLREDYRWFLIYGQAQLGLKWYKGKSLKWQGRRNKRVVRLFNRILDLYSK